MGNSRTFRQHWLVKLALPGLPGFSFIVLTSVAVFYLLHYSRYAPWLFILAVFPFLKLFRFSLAWLRYSVSATAGSIVLVERSGLLNVSERLIPLTQFVTVTYKRPWWASLLHLDVADAIVGAIGGPYVFPSMGDFSDLWVVLQSRGEEVPPKRPSVFVALPRLFLRSSLALFRLIFTGLFILGSSLVSMGRSVFNWLITAFANWVSSLISAPPRVQRRAVPAVGFALDTHPSPMFLKADTERAGSTSPHHRVPDGGYFYRGVHFSSLSPSHAGFYAFCHQFIINDRNWTRWRYHARDSSRRYYPDGISDHVARSYLQRLRQEYILIPGPNGCSGERLSCRIRSIEDIQHLIPDFSGPLDEAA